MSLFYADDVKFSSRNKQIINGITLSVERGSVIGLLGQSGSGKSTLLKLLSGILVPSAGKILYDGICISGFSFMGKSRHSAEPEPSFADS